MAIFSRHGARDSYHRTQAAQRLESSDDALCALIGQTGANTGLWLVSWAHMGRVLTDLDSHLPQARMMTATQADPDGLREVFFAHCTNSLKTDTRHHRETHLGQLFNTFSRRHQKIVSSKGKKIVSLYLLLHLSWGDGIWLESVTCIQLYAFIFIDEKACAYVKCIETVSWDLILSSNPAHYVFIFPGLA